jgi:hypothetical protein
MALRAVEPSREEVMRKYRAWLAEQPQLLDRLPELRGKVLGGWCAPEACQGDVLSELVNRTRNKDA